MNRERRVELVAAAQFIASAIATEHVTRRLSAAGADRADLIEIKALLMEKVSRQIAKTISDVRTVLGSQVEACRKEIVTIDDSEIVIGIAASMALLSIDAADEVCGDYGLL